MSSIPADATSLCVQVQQSSNAAPGLTFEQFQEAQGDFPDAPASPPDDGVGVPVPLPVSRSKPKAVPGSASSYEHVSPFGHVVLASCVACLE